MRTFEQYIRGSYDFRLGGKKRRGFKGCSFSQLEDGDKFYYKFFDDGEYKGKRELKVWDISPAKPTDEKSDAVKSIRFSKVDGDPDIIYTLLLSKEEFDSNAFSTDIELSSNRKRIYVWSTELLSEDDAYEIAYNAEMKESVDFRLGGSKDRGASVTPKTFRDLKMDDTVFMLVYDKMSDEIVDSTEYPCKIIKKGSKLFLKFEEGVFYLDDDLDKSVMFMSYTDKDLYLLAAYDIDQDDPDVIEMIDFYLDNIDESVDFRLGGKANKGVQQFNYFPKDRDELDALMKKLRKERGEEGDFNDVDVSNVTDMSYVFSEGKKFNGDISQWDVSNVTDMSGMFYECENFNGDISNWDVSNVTNMRYMFYKCNSFNQDISSWDVSSVTNMNGMFSGCDSFEGDISNWNVSSVTNMSYTFFNCPIKEEFKPKFK